MPENNLNSAEDQVKQTHWGYWLPEHWQMPPNFVVSSNAVFPEPLPHGSELTTGTLCGVALTCFG